MWNNLSNPYFPFLAHLREGGMDQAREMFFPFMGQECDIHFPQKWKVFSTSLERPSTQLKELAGNPSRNGHSISAFRLLEGVWRIRVPGGLSIQNG